MKYVTKTLTMTALLALAFTSCREDYFDPEGYQKMVAQSFPVQNVDPDQTWATMGTTTARITVLGDAGANYRVKVYDDNPLANEVVTVLYSGKAQSGSTIEPSFTCPLDLNQLYIGVFDADGRRIVQMAPIADGKLTAVVGTASANGSRATRAIESDYQGTYAKTLAQYLNPTHDLYGNALTVRTLSLDEMKACPTLLTNALIAENNTPTNVTGWGGYVDAGGNWVSDGKNHYSGGPDADGHHFRVAAGTELTSVFHLNGQWGVVNDVVVYIEGKVHLNGNTLNGPTLVVANGGEIVVDGKTDMSGAGRIIVLAGGKLTAAGNTAVYNVNNGGICYNAGEISFPGELNVNGSDFYNCGTLTAGVLRNTSGGKFTNFGQITARTNIIAGDTYNSTIVNGCYMHFTGDAGIGSLTMLNNSRLDVDGCAEFTQSFYNLSDVFNPMVLMDKSIVNVGTAYVTNTVFQGPTAASEFAIVKMGAVQVGNGDDIHQQDNCYFDWDVTEVYKKDGGRGAVTAEHKLTDTNPAAANQVLKSHITRFVSEATAPNNITIPAGDCTGSGYNSEGNPGVKEEDEQTKEEPLGLRYCFEDNFPMLGDYDFNDAVITLTPTIDGSTVTLRVSIDAVGASEQLAAGLRIVGLSQADIVSYSADGSFNENLPASSLRIIDNNEVLLPEGMLFHQNDVVINLFNDIHWSLGQRTSDMGTVENWFLNTVERDNAYEYKHNDVAPRVVTFTFHLVSEEAARLFTQENLDLFIVEGYNGGYWEVHTVPFKTYEVLSAYASGNKTMYSDNFPWAICVPASFRYPIEWQTIGMDRLGSITGAYQEPGHSFIEWAKNRNKAKDWYKYPTGGLVY